MHRLYQADTCVRANLYRWWSLLYLDIEQQAPFALATIKCLVHTLNALTKLNALLSVSAAKKRVHESRSMLHYRKCSTFLSLKALLSSVKVPSSSVDMWSKWKISVPYLPSHVHLSTHVQASSRGFSAKNKHTLLHRPHWMKKPPGFSIACIFLSIVWISPASLMYGSRNTAVTTSARLVFVIFNATSRHAHQCWLEKRTR